MSKEKEFRLTAKMKVGLTVVALVVAAILGTAVAINVGEEKIEVTPGVNATIEYAEEEVTPVLEGDLGDGVDLNEIPTVEMVDGGLFEDINDGVSLEDGQYADLGWNEYYDVSSPEAFKNDTLGKCIIANNVYGAQCVSLARVFWYSYAGRDVSTCGTGMAKGMMECAEQNAGDEFEVHWGSAGIRAGDWPIWGNGLYGHVGMALGVVTNGYVALLGENQGGPSCGAGVGGSATNIINLNVNGIIGYYRPKAYIPKPEPEPEPAPAAPDTGKQYVY